MSELDKEPFPRAALIAAASVVGFSLIATTVARVVGIHFVAAPASSAPAQSVDLRFVDQPNGSVSVRDGGDDRQIAYLAPGTNGFVRGVVRGLAHDRKTRGIGTAPPFRLSVWRDGRLALEDTATGRLIDLDAFGASNKDAFVQLLSGDGGRA